MPRRGSLALSKCDRKEKSTAMRRGYVAGLHCRNILPLRKRPSDGSFVFDSSVILAGTHVRLSLMQYMIDSLAGHI
jgi:hypothetical protein